jgi:hypothetical protein
MADRVEPKGAPTEFPPAELPTFFADGVVNVASSSTIAKFYLARIDSSFADSTEHRTQAVAQVVMPLDSFVHEIGDSINRLKRIV